MFRGGVVFIDSAWQRLNSMQTLLQKWEQAAIIALLLKTSFTDLQLYTWSLTVRPDYYRQHLCWEFVLDAIASPSSYPCKVVGHSLIDSFRLHLSSLQACSESSLFNVMNSNLFNLDFHLLSEPIIWMLKECGSIHKMLHKSVTGNKHLTIVIIILLQPLKHVRVFVYFLRFHPVFELRLLIKAKAKLRQVSQINKL